MMDYHIALPAELGLSPDEFAISWNETPQCRSVAEATIANPSETPEGFIAADMAILRNTSEKLDITSVYELIRQAFYGQGISENIDFSKIESPEGINVLMVKMSGD